MMRALRERSVRALAAMVVACLACLLFAGVASYAHDPFAEAGFLVAAAVFGARAILITPDTIQSSRDRRRSHL